MPRQALQHWQNHIPLLLRGALSTPLVELHVVLEVGLALEALLTDGALIRTPAGVNPLVPQQVVAHRERPRTEGARKGTLSRVAPHVPHQDTGSGRLVATYRAPARF